MKTQILKAPDISCDHCERTIRQALGNVPGISRVEVDIPGQEIQVIYDEKRVESSTIETILDRAGYPVHSDHSVRPRKGGSSSCCAQPHNSMVPYLS